MTSSRPRPRFATDSTAEVAGQASSTAAAARAQDLVSGTDIVLVTDAVVVGLGHVGLPLCRTVSDAGLSVVGLDLSPRVIEHLNAGRSPVAGLEDSDVAHLLAAGFRASGDETVLGDAETVVVCVPTYGRPDAPTDLTALVGAARAIARHLRPGMLVVLESTTYPGTTEEVVRPLLEASGLRAGVDFFLAVAPERVDAGAGAVASIPRVVGGSTAACTERAIAFYGRFVDRVVRARGTREAEMAKLIENARRHVAVALANEVAQLSHELGIDVFDAAACAATSPLDPAAAMPASSLGSCTPVAPDPLSVKARFPRRSGSLIGAAQEINDRMPAYVARRVQDLLNRERRAVNGAHVLLLGVTNAPDVADDRGSIASDVARALLELGAHVGYADPYVDQWSVGERSIPRVTALREAMREAHVTVLLQKHAAYDVSLLGEAKLLFDTRGVVPGAERL